MENADDPDELVSFRVLRIGVQHKTYLESMLSWWTIHGHHDYEAPS